MMLKEHEVINSWQEFRHLTFAQVRFFMKKKKEYEQLEKRTKEANERLSKKDKKQ